MNVLFEYKRTILCVMLCIVSWCQGLVMAKDPCEATISKKLAWLMEQLVVSSHEFSFYFVLNQFPKSFYHSLIDVFTNFFVHLCFIFFLFSKPFLFYFHITDFIAFSIYHFWISLVSSCFYSLNKEELLTWHVNRLLMLLLPPVPVDSTRWANTITEVSREH